jgi:hypothetical protein
MHEEGIIRGRNIIELSGLTPELGAAPVNGPSGNKGQYIWDGTYVVELDRGFTIDGVYHMCQVGFAGQDQAVLCWGERVTVGWLNRRNIQIPIIITDNTLDYYNKLLLSRGHLLDYGERIIRSAMAASPGANGDYPFSDNQFNNPKTQLTENNDYDESNAKVVNLPGSETFYDKFGRIINLSRQPNNEFLETFGKTDSGQDYIDDLDTIDEQDSYYDQISSDESDPINPEEPFAPKRINLNQYQQNIKDFKIVGDPDSTRTVRRGLLPRFDKWKFLPIVIRKYEENSDGVVESTTYSEKQERSNTVIGDTITYGYTRTITNKGDIKEFVPRHVNRRIVGDKLESLGGNYDFKIKTNDRLSDGSTNPTNLIHQEMLKDGTYRLKVNENVSTETSNFNTTILPSGTTSVTSNEKIIIYSDKNIYLGGEESSQSILLGDTFKSLFEQLGDALNNWVPITGDGGGALKTLLTSFLTAYNTSKTSGQPNYYLSEKQKVV